MDDNFQRKMCRGLSFRRTADCCFFCIIQSCYIHILSNLLRSDNYTDNYNYMKLPLLLLKVCDVFYRHQPKLERVLLGIPEIIY